jgi:phage gp46-like protein
MTALVQDLSVVVDGVAGSPLAAADPLIRAVIISLFTWRRANPDDAVDGSRQGWWGDATASLTGDRIGSRLWLLSREKLLPETFNRAREHAREALQWLVDDRVAAAVDVAAERYGRAGLALVVTITRADRRVTELRFADVWQRLQNQ